MSTWKGENGTTADAVTPVGVASFHRYVMAVERVEELLQRVAGALAPLDFVPAEALGVQKFVDRNRPSPKTGVHVLMAREKVRPHYSHAAPDPNQAATGSAGFGVLELAELLRMKLQSYRDIDRVHVRDMLAVGLIDPNRPPGLPDDLAERMQAIVDTPE